MSCGQRSRIQPRLLTERFLGTPDAEPNRTEGTRAFARERPKKKKKEKKSVHDYPMTVVVLLRFFGLQEFFRNFWILAKYPP